jgi:hypothetical protein
MMQKNETLLLDPWIRYHASLLGSEHIYVYDNGSSDTAVIQTLRDAEKSGVNVFWDYTRQEDFLCNREELTAGLIRRLDEEHPYDFYFPIDCDEFLACSLPGGTLSCDKQDILDALQLHLQAPEVLVISHKYWNNILYPDLYPFRGRDETETHCDAVGLLRWLTFGDSSRPLAVAQTSPISGLQTRHKHHW